jgi:hypothetical protein
MSELESNWESPPDPPSFLFSYNLSIPASNISSLASRAVLKRSHVHHNKKTLAVNGIVAHPIDPKCVDINV